MGGYGRHDSDGKPALPMGSPEAPLLYLELLKGTLTRTIVEGEGHRPLSPRGAVRKTIARAISAALRPGSLELVRRYQVDPAVRAEGRDWPPEADTMVGLKRLDNLQGCIEEVIREGVPGDLIECGVWRGGSVILMRAALRAYGITDRIVWAADSFSGFPSPGPADTDEDSLHDESVLAVSVEEVRRNFARYGLLDDRVRFLVGWFEETLPSAPIDHLAVLRLDSDRYDSTMDCLVALYPKLSPGGFVVIDDYGAHPGCKRATDDFRRSWGIDDRLLEIDWSGVYWRREA